MAFTGFGGDALDFFHDLGRNNERTWWQAHKETWTRSVAEPLRALADDLTAEFGAPHLFRPNRDVRFSTDKRPYQEHASFAAGQGSEAAGGGVVYFQISADDVFVAGGWWRPTSAQLAAFRTAVDDPATAAGLHALLDDLRAQGLELGDGDPVATAPRGWPRDHPEIELLRLRSLTVGRHREPGPWVHTPELLDVVRTDWRQIRRFADWLATIERDRG